MWEQLKRIIKQNGAIVLFGSQPFTSALIMSNAKMFKYCWVWNKSKAGNFAISKSQPLRITEDIIIFCESKTTYNAQMETAKKQNIRPRGNSYKQKNGTSQGMGSGLFFCSETHNETMRHPKNIIDIKSTEGECNNTRRSHPTQKPVALLEYLIRTYTNEGETVLDFTAGSGTAGIAALNTNRNAILIEREPEYCEIIKRRIAEAEQNKANRLFAGE